MHNSTSKRKGFRLVAAFGTVVAALFGTVALVAGVTPAWAANVASQPDTQVAVFMVPLTLLVLVLLFEVGRFVLRGNLPVEAPVRASRRTALSASDPRSGR